MAGRPRAGTFRFRHAKGGTMKQILIALGLWRFETVGFSNNGVIHLKERLT